MLGYWWKHLSWQKTRTAWREKAEAWRRFWASFHSYADLASPQSAPSMKLLYPCLGDNTATTFIEPTYFYQDAWAFESIIANHPALHVDVGSHHTFVALLSKVVPVTMVDIRPLSLPMSTLTFRQGSILDLPYDDNSVISVSSLCVVEHIGLGRYGDPLDPHGTEKAILELKRIIKPGGMLYLSVPLDNENNVYFNAHRAFTESYLKEQFEPFEIIQKRYIYGSTFGEEKKTGFGVGCFQLKKRLLQGGG